MGRIKTGGKVGQPAKYKLIDEKLCCIACLQQCNWQSQPWLHIKICKYEKVEGIWRCKACHTVCEIPSSHADNCPMQDISSSSPKKPARIKTAKQTSKGPIRSLTSKLENSGSVSVIDAKEFQQGLNKEAIRRPKRKTTVPVTNFGTVKVPKRTENSLPRLEAMHYFKTMIKQWDPQICDKIKPIPKKISKLKKISDKMPVIPISSDYATLMKEMNAIPNPDPLQKSKFLRYNEATSDMLIGLIICIIESIYGKDNDDDKEEKCEKLFDPNDVLLLLTPLLLKGRAGLQCKPPFLNGQWFDNLILPRKRQKPPPGPGVRLESAFLLTDFAKILNSEDKEKWTTVGPHELNVEDGKSLYPKQFATDLAVSAAMHLLVQRSQSDPRMIKANYISADKFAYLNDAFTGNKHFERGLHEVVGQASDISDWEIFLGPMYVAYNQHWMLAIARRSTKRVTLFDPFQYSMKIGTKVGRSTRRGKLGGNMANELISKLNVFRMLLNALTGEEWSQREHFKDSSFVIDSEVPAQKDGWSCGPMIIMYGEKLLNREFFLDSGLAERIANMNDGYINLRIFRDIQLNGVSMEPTPHATLPEPAIPVLRTMPDASISIARSLGSELNATLNAAKHSSKKDLTKLPARRTKLKTKPAKK